MALVLDPYPCLLHAHVRGGLPRPTSCCSAAPGCAPVCGPAELQAANTPLHPVVALALQTPQHRQVVLAAIAGSGSGGGGGGRH